MTHKLPALSRLHAICSSLGKAVVWSIALTIAFTVGSIGNSLKAIADEGINSSNVGFLPGDAFFADLLSEEQSIAIAEGPAEILLNYRQPLMSGGLGLKAGFYRLAVRNVTPKTRGNIAAAYREIRRTHPRVLLEVVGSDGQRELVERNSLNLLVYPANCDFALQRLGIKYNEGWSRQAFTIEGLADHVESRRVSSAPYVSFVVSSEAIAEDWRNAESFPALDVSIPEGSKDPFIFGRPNITTLFVDMLDVTLVILAEDDIHAYFAREPYLKWVEVRSNENVLVKEFDENGKVVVDEKASERISGEINRSK